MPDVDRVMEVTIIGSEDLDSARAIAAKHGVDIQKVAAEGLEPLTTVTLLLLGSALGVATVAQALEQLKGGQVIDLRPGTPRAFYRSKDVIYGLIIVVAHNGKMTVEVKEPRGMFGNVIDALRSITAGAAHSGIGAIAAQTSTALGGSANVSVEKDGGPATPEP